MPLPRAVLAALAFLTGTSLAGLPTQLPITALAGLAGLALAGRWRWALLLAVASVGALNGVVRGPVAQQPPGWLDVERPVEARLRIRGHWVAWEHGWSAPAETIWLAQGPRVSDRRLQLYLQLPEAAAVPSHPELVVRGHLRRRPGAANRRPAPPGPWRLAAPSPRLVTGVRAAGPLGGLATTLRARAEEVIERGAAGNGPGKALVRTLLLGDRSGLPKSWLQGLRRSGLAHLLAISGLHVAMVGALAWGVGSLLGPRRLGLVLALLAVLGYLALVGPRPSILRASLMALLAGGALLLRRSPEGLQALAWAAILLVAHRPDLVRDLGFQLSASATAGILLLAPRFESAWGGGLPVRSLAVSVAAQISSWPWALPAFHLLCPWAPMLNLVAIPWTALALGAGLLWLGVAALLPPAGAALAPLLDLLAAPFGWTARPPPAGWWVMPVAASHPAALGLAAAVALAAWQPRRFLVIPLLCLGVGLCHPLGQQPSRPSIAFLDVGQGDAILLRHGDRALLFDGGGRPFEDTGGRILLPALVGEGVVRLGAVALSHPHRDHCGGLVDIAMYLPIEEVWLSSGWEPSACLDGLLGVPGARVVWVEEGERHALGEWGLGVLYPPAAGSEASPNDRSLVLRAEARGRGFLLTGDIERAAEEELVLRKPDELASHVLKIPHHGSRTSTSRPLLAAVGPRIAVVSAGRRNPYGHPAAEVLARLRAAGVAVYRTDLHGAVHFQVGSGDRWRMETLGPAP